MAGIEWEFAKNVANRFIERECKLCHVSKSGGAPRIRENFLGGPKKSCRVCTHPHDLVVAKRLREEFGKKDAKRLYHVRVEVAASQVQHGSNNHTPEVTPIFTLDPNDQGETHIRSVSSKHPSIVRNATMCQTSLQGNAMLMVDNEHWKKAWKNLANMALGFCHLSIILCALNYWRNAM